MANLMCLATGWETATKGSSASTPRGNLGARATHEQPYAVAIDRARMDQALAGPTFTLPNGLSPEEIIAYICQAAQTQK